MRKFLKMISNNMHRPLSLVWLKMMTSYYYKKYCKNNKYRDKFYGYMKKKENWFNTYFYKHYKDILNYSQNNNITKNKQPYIFVFWDKGLDNATFLIKDVNKSICKHAGNYKVINLDNSNYKDFVTIDKKIEDYFERGIISIQNFSDYLRVKLLSEYNCLWVDATLLALKDIPDWYSKEEFFSVNSPNMYDGKKEYSLYPIFNFGQVYLLGGSNKRIFKQLSMFFELYLKKKKVYLDYFMIYYFFNFLYTYDYEDKKIIDALPLNNEHIEDYFYYRDEPANYVPIDEKDVFAKLSYKFDLTKTLANKKSLLYSLLKYYL